MGTNVKKVVRNILCVAGVIILLVLSSIGGMYIERNHQETLEMQKEHISTIAVINMDDGIAMGETQTNYASQLISFPSDDFTVTGLADAKEGIENGTYAAYIVIPETFSATVTSIENEPKKVTIGYQYNEKLDEESKLQAINDINAFINLLNSNVAYMYMDAILAEFHQVQDDSETILSNDNTELEQLANVDAAQLIVAAEPVEEAVVENDIKPVDLTAYTEQNKSLLESMLLSYTEATQKGKEDYISIQDTNIEVGTAKDNFFSTYRTVVEDSISGQDKLLVSGRNNLAYAVGSYNQDIDVKREDAEQIVEKIVKEQINCNQTEADQQLEELLQKTNQDNYKKLYNLQNAWEDAYEKMKGDVEKNLQFQLGNTDDSTDKTLENLIVSAYTQGLNDGLDVLNNDIEQRNGEGEITARDIQGIIANYKNTNSLQNTAECENQINVLKTKLATNLRNIHIDWESLNTDIPTIDENALENREAEDKNQKTETDVEEKTDVDGETDVEGETDGGDETEKSEDEEKKPQIILTKINDEQIADDTEMILDLFKMKSDSEEINQIIQTYFVDALSEENEKQMKRLSDAELQLSQSMDNYENRLVTYDPLKYIENANLNVYLNDIETNAGEMLGVVEENNSAYMLYATEMYTNTMEHTTLLEGSFDEANKQTTTNVENCINDLTASREEINNQNVGMLEGFTDSLKYTRVESQGNAEVYDYIVNPVASQLNGQNITNMQVSTSRKKNPVRNWLILILGIGIIVCVMAFLIHFRNQHKGSMEEREDLF